MPKDSIDNAYQGIRNTLVALINGSRPMPLQPNKELLQMGQVGGSQYRTFSTKVLTPDNAKYCRIESSIDLLALLQVFEAAENATKVIIDSFTISLQCECTARFLCSPFLFILENGESITATSSDDTNPVTALATAHSGGTYTAKFAEVLEGKPFRDNGASYYKAQTVLQIKSEVSKYLKNFYMEMMDEETLNPFGLGYHHYGKTAITALTVQELIIVNYHYKEIPMGAI
jgi:hypothetical protein